MLVTCLFVKKLLFPCKTVPNVSIALVLYVHLQDLGIVVCQKWSDLLYSDSDQLAIITVICTLFDVPDFGAS